MTKIDKVSHNLPFALGICFIVFLMLFSLDVFESGKNIWQILVGLFIHNIPALILTFFLILAKKNELITSVAFIIAGMIYIVSLFTSTSFEWYMISWSFLIAGPAFLIGILFAISWYQKKQN